MKIIAIANQKGGVGKTTTTLALGTALADQGYRILLIDLDPQSSLTISTGLDPDDLEEEGKTLYSVITAFLKDREPQDLRPITRSVAPTLDLLPTSIDLASTEVDLLNAVRREYVLKRLLRPIHDQYDVALIDCPPSLSLLTLNALTAADEVLIPLVPEFLAARGVGYLLQTIQNVRKSELNETLGIAGIVFTMVDTRTKHGKQIADSVRARLDGQVPLLGEIKRSIKASEASAEGVSILRYAEGSEMAQAYIQLARRLAQSWALPTPLAPEVTHA